jgi:hypothetical protein
MRSRLLSALDLGLHLGLLVEHGPPCLHEPDRMQRKPEHKGKREKSELNT